MFKDKSVFVTGGTGTLGRELVKQLLRTNVSRITVFSRDEQKQFRMREKVRDLRVQYVIGDIRDLPAVLAATVDEDIIIHTAALKHIGTAEEQPLEVYKTNVQGSQNILMAAMYNNVEKCILISTDKAVEPSTAYGASKLMAEKMFLAEGRTVVRYGNVLGSKGSVLETWERMKKEGKTKVSLTHLEMTRFFIDIEDAAAFVLFITRKEKEGNIYIPMMKKYKMVDLIPDGMSYTLTGLRPAEKLHEKLFSKNERGMLTKKPGYFIIGLDGKQEMYDLTSDVVE